MKAYLFYYEEQAIVDHDDDGAVYAPCRINLGVFFDFHVGSTFYQYKYPYKTIEHEIITIEDYGV